MDIWFEIDNSYGYIRDADIDQVMKKIKVTVDDQKRAELARELQRLVYERLPRIPVYYANVVYGVGLRVKEWIPIEGGNAVSVNLETVKLTE